MFSALHNIFGIALDPLKSLSSSGFNKVWRLAQSILRYAPSVNVRRQQKSSGPFLCVDFRCPLSSKDGSNFLSSLRSVSMHQKYWGSKLPLSSRTLYGKVQEVVGTGAQHLARRMILRVARVLRNIILTRHFSQSTLQSWCSMNHVSTH